MILEVRKMCMFCKCEGVSMEWSEVFALVRRLGTWIEGVPYLLFLVLPHSLPHSLLLSSACLKSSLVGIQVWPSRSFVLGWSTSNLTQILRSDCGWCLFLSTTLFTRLCEMSFRAGLCLFTSRYLISLTRRRRVFTWRTMTSTSSQVPI